MKALAHFWQLPQNLLGLLFLLFIRGEERHTLNGVDLLLLGMDSCDYRINYPEKLKF
jgi:hypothetical protein